MLLLNIYFTNFNSALYEDENILISGGASPKTRDLLPSTAELVEPEEERKEVKTRESPLDVSTWNLSIYNLVRRNMNPNCAMWRNYNQRPDSLTGLSFITGKTTIT